MKIITTILLGIMVLLGSGCGYREGVVAGSEKSYLFFTGTMSEVEVSVDEGSPFEAKTGDTQLYKIAPGKHRITVTMGGKVVVDREVYVGSGTSKEIQVPNVR
jgi:hypothetical protein